MAHDNWPARLLNTHGDVLRRGLWSGRPEGPLSLENRGETWSVLHHDRKGSDYLIHRGTMADFRSLQSEVPGRGQTRVLSIDLAVRIPHGSQAKVNAVVLEYDASGAKTQVSFYAPGALRMHALGEDCAHYLVALRVQGIGAALIAHFRVDGHRGPVVPEPMDWMVERAVEPLPAVVGETLQRTARQLPDSTGSRHHTQRPYRVGVIGPASIRQLLAGGFEQIQQIVPGAEPESSTPDQDLLLVVEAPAAPIPARAAEPDDLLAVEIRRWQSAGRPTLFLSTIDTLEPPAELGVRTLVDHVLTVAPTQVDPLREALGHDRVHVAPAAIDPRRHHPVGAFREPLPGTLYQGGYPQDEQAAEDLELMLDSVQDSGVELVIHETPDSSANQLPARYRSRTLRAPEGATAPLDKLFRHHLSLAPQRMGESLWNNPALTLQAQGLSVVSTFSGALYNAMPQVRFVSVHEDLNDLRAPLTTVELGARLDGLRAVMSQYTVFHLADTILQAAGLAPGDDRSTVLVLADDPETLRPQLERQSYTDWILRARSDVPDSAALDDLCRTAAVAYLAPWNADQQYGADYLQDRINAFRFTDSDYVTQHTTAATWQLGDGTVHEYTDRLGRPEHTVYSLARRPASAWLEQDENQQLPGGYAVDPFQVNCPIGRRFVTGTTAQDSVQPLLSVVIPVYNNGRYLLQLSLPSLARQELWPRIHVSLVDDGSSDLETLEICASLAQECPNITLHQFHDGGSGSASRPRNIGACQAPADLVTFLDPDNEIGAGGYDRLVALHQQLRDQGQPVQLVAGYQVKVAERSQLLGQHVQGNQVLDNPRETFFGPRRFPLISTQAAVMDRSLFLEGLDFVEGAIGEDTLFGWEVLLRADGVCLTDAAHLLYYSGRAGSLTNSVGLSFFQKHLVLERERVPRLRAYGLLEDYQAVHLQHYLDNWYAPRLDTVPAHERAASEQILAEIISLYPDADTDETVR